MPPLEKPEGFQVTQDFLKNIQLYEQMLGILYLHPCYLYRLLIAKESFEEERVMSIIN
jgi:hypothetical protein